MIGKTNCGGGGGGLKSTDAILRVIAPAGSTVTISKSGVSKSDNGHENHDDSTLYDYYFVIKAGQFDSVTPWTVTATLGSKTATDTIIIDSADEYDVILHYAFYLWGDGVVTESDWTFVGKAYSSSYSNTVVPVHSVTDGVMSLYVTATSSQSLRGGLSYFTTPVDLTDYSTLEMVGTITNGNAAEDGCGLAIYSSVPTYLTSTARATKDVGARDTTITNPTIDVSSLTGTGIIGIKLIARYNETRGSASITSLRLR